MELFTIHCTTCRARLKVNDESAIGKILACPKCHSMVQVVPPVGWQSAAAAAATPGELVFDEPAVKTGSSILSSSSSSVIKASGAVPPALPPRGGPRPSDSTASIAASAAATSAPPLPELPAANQPAAASAGAEVGPGVETAPAAAGTTTWAALAARARQDWPILGGGLLAGVVLGAIVWLFIASQSADELTVAQAQAPAEADTPPLAPTRRPNGPAAAAVPPRAAPAPDEPTEDVEETVPVDSAPRSR